MQSGNTQNAMEHDFPVARSANVQVRKKSGFFEISSLVFPDFFVYKCVLVLPSMCWKHFSEKKLPVCRTGNMPEIAVFSYFHDYLIIYLLYDYFFTEKVFHGDAQNFSSFDF